MTWKGFKILAKISTRNKLHGKSILFFEKKTMLFTKIQSNFTQY